LAGKVAMEKGYAINIGGGFHHCCGYQGGGFCAYADITLSLRYVRKYFGINRVMIIDLDAHQGNGHEVNLYNAIHCIKEKNIRLIGFFFLIFREISWKLKIMISI
jgi:acetoin utilization deacetylase AcuC-like enzyme